MNPRNPQDTGDLVVRGRKPFAMIPTDLAVTRRSVPQPSGCGRSPTPSGRVGAIPAALLRRGPRFPLACMAVMSFLALPEVNSDSSPRHRA